MSARWIGIVALLGLLGVLVAVALFEPGREAPPAPAALTTLGADGIDRIRIRRPQQPDIALRRVDGQWRLVEPLAIAANRYRVDELLKLAAAKTRTQLAVDALDLGALELDPPRATLTLNDTVFDFGGTDAIDGHRYVRVGDTVGLTIDRFYHHLVAAPSGWVSRRLLDNGAAPVRIELPDRTYALHDGVWTVTPDDVASAAGAGVADAWRRAEAIDIRPAPAISDALPRARITLDGQASPVEFVIVSGDQADALLARPDTGLGWLVSETTWNALRGLPPVDEASTELPHARP